MNINYKKSAKLILLLISTLLIATANATIYDYMNLNATVGVQGMYLAWVNGDEATSAGTQINGVTATLTNLQGPPNGTRIYADPVRLNNTGTSSITFDLLVDTVSGNTENLDSIYVKIYSMNTTTWIRNATIWENGAKGTDETNLSIPNNNMWKFQWEITWKSTATTDSVEVNLKLKVPVA